MYKNNNFAPQLVFEFGKTSLIKVFPAITE